MLAFPPPTHPPPPNSPLPDLGIEASGAAVRAFWGHCEEVLRRDVEVNGAGRRGALGSLPR